MFALYIIQLFISTISARENDNLHSSCLHWHSVRIYSLIQHWFIVPVIVCFCCSTLSMLVGIICHVNQVKRRDIGADTIIKYSWIIPAETGAGFLFICVTTVVTSSTVGMTYSEWVWSRVCWSRTSSVSVWVGMIQRVLESNCLSIGLSGYDLESAGVGLPDIELYQSVGSSVATLIRSTTSPISSTATGSRCTSSSAGSRECSEWGFDGEKMSVYVRQLITLRQRRQQRAVTYNHTTTTHTLTHSRTRQFCLVGGLSPFSWIISPSLFPSSPSCFLIFSPMPVHFLSLSLRCGMKFEVGFLL